jgi:transcriptional regulator
VEALKKGIVGVEIVIKRIEGKFKMSQENELGDWEGVVDGFKGLGTEDGKRMAEAVEARGKDRLRSGKGDDVIGGEEIIRKGDGADHELSSASAHQAKAEGI